MLDWNILSTEEELENIKKESETHPVLIFKHSTRCSISSAAKDRLERNWKAEEVKGVKPYYLDLIAFRPVSNKIQNDFHVQHESPQVLLIKNGQSVYDASHIGINYRELLGKISQLV